MANKTDYILPLPVGGYVEIEGQNIKVVLADNWKGNLEIHNGNYPLYCYTDEPKRIEITGATSGETK